MPSGSAPAGSTTSTQTSPATPYVTQGLSEAQRLYNNNSDPLKAQPNPGINTGYEALAQQGRVVDTSFLPQVSKLYSDVATGITPGLQQLTATANGDYVNSNPYLAKLIQNTLDPIASNFRTSTAPTLDAAAAASGRYGSGAQRGVYSTAEQNLARQLSTTSTALNSANYDAERARQLAAAGTLTNANLSTLSQYPSFVEGTFAGPKAQVQGGTGQTAYEQSLIDANSPYTRLDKYLSELTGTPSGGGSATTPRFQNETANLLSGIGGTIGIGKSLGLGELLGGGGSAATGLGGAIDFGGGGALLGVADSALPAALGAEAALPLAAAATIVCTELVSQGRMPNRWRIAGMRQFLAYPEIARRGYWVWAKPVVEHLRKHPDSRRSKLVEVVFCWRAEDLAARNGVAGARKLLRGRLVTAAMVLPCLVCGIATVPKRFWRTRNRAA